MQTLLVVEDNDEAREGLARFLRGHGYQVVLAADGEQALSCLRCSPRPDLILLDMLLPVLDGWHFLERVRQQQQGGQPPVPVVITTGTNLTREWALDHGCQGFIRKPIDTDRLLDEVRRC